MAQGPLGPGAYTPRDTIDKPGVHQKAPLTYRFGAPTYREAPHPRLQLTPKELWYNVRPWAVVLLFTAVAAWCGPRSPIALEHRVRVVPSTLDQARTKRWRLKRKPSLWGMVATLLVLMYATN